MSLIEPKVERRRVLLRITKVVLCEIHELICLLEYLHRLWRLLLLSLEADKGGITDGEVGFEGILVELGEVEPSWVWSLQDVGLMLLGLWRDRLGVIRDEGLLLEDTLDLIGRGHLVLKG
jgi:hypothetical protein